MVRVAAWTDRTSNAGPGKPADDCGCSVCSAVLGWLQTLLCGVRWQGALPGSGLWLAVTDTLETHLGGELNRTH